MNNPWFRMYSEFRTDPKVQTMSESMQRRFIMLMCLESDGDLQKLTDAEIAFALNISIKKFSKTKEVLFNKQLISIRDGKICIQLSNGRDDGRPSSEEWRRLRSIVFERDNYTCQYCGAHGVKLECDHIIPICKGGSNGLENLTTSCFPCNRSKSGKTPKEWGYSNEVV